MWRAGLARAYCDTDQLAEARAQVDALRVSGFDYPPNQPWTGIVVALSVVVSDLQDRSAAAVLYERMRPIAKQADAVSYACQGSYGLPRGMLATALYGVTRRYSGRQIPQPFQPALWVQVPLSHSSAADFTDEF